MIFELECNYSTIQRVRNAQADRKLHWPHMSEYPFSHDAVNVYHNIIVNSHLIILVFD